MKQPAMRLAPTENGWIVYVDQSKEDTSPAKYKIYSTESDERAQEIVLLAMKGKLE